VFPVPLHTVSATILAPLGRYNILIQYYIAHFPLTWVNLLTEFRELALLSFLSQYRFIKVFYFDILQCSNHPSPEYLIVTDCHNIHMKCAAGNGEFLT